MKEKILKFWRDPVWSKVISVGIISFFTLVYNLLNALFAKSSFKVEFIAFWTTEFELWRFVLISAILFIIYWTFGFLTRRMPYSYDPGIFSLDSTFFTKLSRQLLTEENMIAIKTNEFSSNPFEPEKLDFIYYILQEELKSDFEFINPELELLKNELLSEIRKLQDFLGKYIYGTRDSNWLSIPREWVSEQPERFERARRELSSQENIVAQKYEKLIRTCRRVLKVEA